MNVITKMNAKCAIPFEDVVVNEGDAVTIKVSHVRRLSSNTLFGDAKEIVISHLGEAYMLTITKQKKLLLTKAKQDFAV